MNNDRIAERLMDIVNAAGVTIRATHHASSLTLELTTSAPLTWSFADCDRASRAILDADCFGKPVGACFGTTHDSTHNHWRFQLVNQLPELPGAHVGDDALTPEQWAEQTGRLFA